MPKQATPDLRPVLEHLAKFTNMEFQALVLIEEGLPRVRELCPDWYEPMAHLLIDVYQSLEAATNMADNIVDGRSPYDTVQLTERGKLLISPP